MKTVHVEKADDCLNLEQSSVFMHSSIVLVLSRLLELSGV